MNRTAWVAVAIVFFGLLLAILDSNIRLIDLRDPGADADSTTTSSDSGLEFINNELSLIRGCSDGQVLVWTEATDSWGCGTN